MERDYQPQIIEPEIQKYWESEKTFRTTEDHNKPKVLLSLHVPISIRKLHMGHVRNYTIGGRDQPLHDDERV